MGIREMVQKHEQDIMRYAEEYLASKSGQNLIKKSVEQQIKDIIEDDYVEELLSAENRKKFRSAIEQSIRKRLSL